MLNSKVLYVYLNIGKSFNLAGDVVDYHKILAVS